MRRVVRAPKVRVGSKMRFLIFLGLLLPTSSCASKPFILRYRYMFYEVMLQVLLGLKEDEKDRQGAKCQRSVQNAIFNISRSPAPKPALVPTSRIYCDINVCSMKVCRKSHND